MARKKVETTEEVVEQTQPTESLDITPTVETISSEPEKPVDVVEELYFAQKQIEHCEDYLNVNDIGPNGYYRASVKDWKRYKYQLRRYSAGNAPLPVRPEIIKDY